MSEFASKSRNFEKIQFGDSSGGYTNYDLVCGCNEKTYSNECEARSHGITSFSAGKCASDN